MTRLFLVPIIMLFSIPLFAQNTNSPGTSNGIEFPADYKNWHALGVSHRNDNNTLRMILGNEIASKAARQGNTNPWPEGSMLAKIVWKDQQHPSWPTATIPGNLVHSEFMLKDSTRFAATKGWGYARWLGMQQKPVAEPDFDKKCMNCHEAVKANDYVFTFPAELPR